MEIGNLTTAEKYFEIERKAEVAILRIVSSDGANKLEMARIRALHRAVQELAAEAKPGDLKRLIITGNDKFFSAGADLNEVSISADRRRLSFLERARLSCRPSTIFRFSDCRHSRLLHGRRHGPRACL